MPRRRLRPPFAKRRSGIHGHGVFATRRIRTGQILISYVGQSLTKAEARERYSDDDGDDPYTLLFHLGGDRYIDAAVDGNDARFINHSCEPNCEAINDRKRIFIEAIKTIPAGTELVYDYQYERTDDHTADDEKFYRCRCGSPKCRGTILAPVVTKG